jgi:hypothetical protein
MAVSTARRARDDNSEPPVSSVKVDSGLREYTDAAEGRKAGYVTTDDVSNVPDLELWLYVLALELAKAESLDLFGGATVDGGVGVTTSISGALKDSLLCTRGGRGDRATDDAKSVGGSLSRAIAGWAGLLPVLKSEISGIACIGGRASGGERGPGLLDWVVAKEREDSVADKRSKADSGGDGGILFGSIAIVGSVDVISELFTGLQSNGLPTYKLAVVRR